MKLFNLIVTKELQVAGDTICTCDVTGVDTLSAAKSCMRTIYDSFNNDGYVLHDSKSLSNSYSWFVFKKLNVTYKVQLTKAII